MEQSLAEKPQGASASYRGKHAVIAIAHSCLSYPSGGAVPDMLGQALLIQRRLSARMSVDEPLTRLGIPAEPLQV